MRFRRVSPQELKQNKAVLPKKTVSAVDTESPKQSKKQLAKAKAAEAVKSGETKKQQLPKSKGVKLEPKEEDESDDDDDDDDEMVSSLR